MAWQRLSLLSCILAQVLATGPACWNQVLKAGACNSKILKCPSDWFVNKYAIYAIPCSDQLADPFYDLDPGWGGAHMTLTSFEGHSEINAKLMFAKVKASLRAKLGSKGVWRPGNFYAKTSKSGFRGMGVSSANLDVLYKTIKKAGWKGEDKVGHHVTLSIITGERFQKGTGWFDVVSNWFHQVPWAVVLVKAFKGKDGKLYFQRSDGFELQEWDTRQWDCRSNQTAGIGHAHDDWFARNMSACMDACAGTPDCQGIRWTNSSSHCRIVSGTFSHDEFVNNLQPDPQDESCYFGTWKSEEVETLV